MFSWLSNWASPRNPAYNSEGDDELRRSLNSLDKMDDNASKVDSLPPGDRPQPSGQNVVEKSGSGSPEYTDANKPRRSSYDRLDRDADKSQKDRSDDTVQRNLLWGNKNDTSDPSDQGPSSSSKHDPRAGSSMSQASQKSSATVVQHIDDIDDDFPWNQQPRKASHASIDMDATSVTMHDMRRSSEISQSEADKKRVRFLWWKNMMRKLHDNKIHTKEDMKKLILQDQMQDKQFRMVKKVMNVVFLFAGIVLLLAVIVLIISTDPQFDESMKALTVFLAGRRQGIW